MCSHHSIDIVVNISLKWIHELHGWGWLSFLQRQGFENQKKHSRHLPVWHQLSAQLQHQLLHIGYNHNIVYFAAILLFKDEGKHITSIEPFHFLLYEATMENPIKPSSTLIIEGSHHKNVGLTAKAKSVRGSNSNFSPLGNRWFSTCNSLSSVKWSRPSMTVIAFPPRYLWNTNTPSVKTTIPLGILLHVFLVTCTVSKTVHVNKHVQQEKAEQYTRQTHTCYCKRSGELDDVRMSQHRRTVAWPASCNWGANININLNLILSDNLTTSISEDCLIWNKRTLYISWLDIVLILNLCTGC